jgi:hypothetical protein
MYKRNKFQNEIDDAFGDFYFSGSSNNNIDILFSRISSIFSKYYNNDYISIDIKNNNICFVKKKLDSKNKSYILSFIIKSYTVILDEYLDREEKIICDITIKNLKGYKIKKSTIEVDRCNSINFFINILQISSCLKNENVKSISINYRLLK